MKYRDKVLVSISALIVAACATPQENPNYQYSTKYKGASPYQSAGVQNSQVQTTPVSYRHESYQAPLAPPVATYQTASHSAQSSSQAASYNPEYQACLSRETNRQLIGGAVGGSAGAFIGKELIGGTAGTLVGAGIGGTAGYGVGNLSTNCEQHLTPVFGQSASTYTPQSGAVQTYGAQQSATNASYNSSSLPSYQIAGTTTTPYVEESVITETVIPASNVSLAQTAIQAPSPTDAAYGQTSGTPGYEALIASQNTNVPSTQIADISQPQSARAIVTDLQPITRSASSQTLTAGFAPQGFSSQALSHIVEEGDTVYSLSRSVCSSIEDVQRLNGLGANFGIRIGDQIQLPASRC